MKIESSNIAMSTLSTQTKTYSSMEQLNSWVDAKSPTAHGDIPNELNHALKTFLEDIQSATLSSASVVEEEYLFELTPEDEKKINLLNKLLEALTGKKFKFHIPRAFHKIQSPTPGTYSAPKIQVQSQGQPLQRQGWGINYQKHESYSEASTLDFDARGIVRTSDGKAIKLDISLSMSRTYSTESHVSFKAGDALIDPLIINYDGAAANLSNQKISFDLDNDGKDENLSFVKSGSGFLVFDKNNDGKINNGSELFGPQTGNGFMELRAFDIDGNNWIDESDPIYEKLQIWTKDEDGNDQLFAIGQKGIGAIYLNAIQSEYELKDVSNNLLGKIQQTSIFLREDGTAGTIQHVDLSV
ncbi:MAG: hypothetical protein CVU84_07330 [Firmicutes bacterium HGW-Firmicutes-1]|jgi:hypothetical protein|nr:MAG: hypothetical protein CVU84_07330 [Firmicutes bacterium HGW-Firmicutes-1]